MTTPVPVTHSLPDPQALLAGVLAGYDLGEFVDCRLWYAGVNDTYLARTAAGAQYILRLYRSRWRSPADVGYETDALNHLHQKGLAVAYPLPRRDGSCVHALRAPEGDRLAVLFTFAEGKEPSYEADPADKSFRYGQAVARIHQASDDFTSPYLRQPLDLDFLFFYPLKAMRPFLAHRPDDFAFFQAYAEKMVQRLTDWPASALDQGFCHADLQGYHAHITDDGTLTFFDFDCCGRGFRAYDMAVFRWCARLSEKEPIWWEPYLRGYREVRPLRDADVQAIPYFVAARYFWHIGLHTGNAYDWGYGWLNDGYFDRAIKNLKAVQADYGFEA
ncbi:MAG: phosphotransferase enzyme family protein [Chloroflexota bacterium]